MEVNTTKTVLIWVVLTTFIVNISGLRIGAFNIQVFGRSKASKPEVMRILVGILSRYDLVLIQEIRDSKGTAINTLLNQVNEANSDDPFQMSLSDRLGRTNSKEQYAYLYRPSAFEIVDYYTYDDGDESLKTDKFEREPFVVLLESKQTEIKRFAVAGVHVDPDEAVEELQHLKHVVEDVKSKFSVDDVILMGDLNADCSYVPKYKWKDVEMKELPDYHWLITDDIDTTVSGSDCAYDRFIVTGKSLVDSVVPGSSRVFLFDNHYELDNSQAKAVSDHYPIELELKVVNGSSTGHLLPVYLTIACVLLTAIFFILY